MENYKEKMCQPKWCLEEVCKLIVDPYAFLILNKRQLEVVALYSRLINTSKDDFLWNAKARWKELPERLHRREIHSLLGLRTTFFRDKLYIESIWRITFNWIGLKFSFPLLTHPIPYYQQFKELDVTIKMTRWKELIIFLGYYPKEAMTHWIYYNLIEECLILQRVDEIDIA